jgi:methionine-rich copper-binding protein CopC
MTSTAGSAGASLLFGALAIGIALSPAGAASAHNSLVSSTPEAGSTVTVLPDVVSITTSEALLDLAGDGSGFGLRVHDENGLYYGDGCVTVSDATMSTDAALGPAGQYTVIWQVVSADAHPVSDTFEFEWAPSDEAEPSVGTVTPPDCNGTVNVGEPEATAAAETGSEDGADAAASDSTALWVIGTVVAVGAAVGVTLLAVRPRTKRRPENEHQEAENEH